MKLPSEQLKDKLCITAPVGEQHLARTALKEIERLEGYIKRVKEAIKDKQEWAESFCDSDYHVGATDALNKALEIFENEE